MSSEFLEKDIIYINSINRSSGTSNDFIIDISQQIKPNNNYDSISLLNFTCPKSYYLITNINNKFTVVEGLNNTVITIPEGNYDFLTMRSTLQNLLLSCNFTYTVSADQIKGKYIFSVSNNTSQPQFIFDENSPHRIIGFEKDTYNFSSNSLTSENIVNFQLTNTIELCCDIVKKNVFASIIQNTQDFSNITYTEFNNSMNSQDLIKNKINSVRFYLLDGNTGKQLNLNGLNFAFTFCIYKKNNYYSHMLEDMKNQAMIRELEEEINKLESKLQK